MRNNGGTPRHANYHFSHVLGSGSDGTVWKATYVGPAPLGDLEPGTNVAIKVVPPDKLRDNEILLQAQLRHLNIVQLYDIFECVLIDMTNVLISLSVFEYLSYGRIHSLAFPLDCSVPRHSTCKSA